MSVHGSSPYQSLIFVPGDRPERFEKALGSGADAVIVDLEDAVAPTAKAHARSAISSWASPEKPVLLRVNARGTPWFADDIKLVGLPGIAGIVLPKTESIRDFDALFDGAYARVPVYPLIETGAGVWNAREIAGAPHVRQLLFGTLDFIADMSIDGDGEELNPYRAMLALVSRVAGIEPPIDGVTPAIDDPDRVMRDALNGRRVGFGGKLCIHPKQVPIVKQCYRPSREELDWATRVLEASERAVGAALVLDGKMVDRPVVLKAQRILATARG
ncbi:HpcH/HpaI aldolase/citrate lyase family protein [Burkholderia territorii]|uniref:HpcH/HpaI aldolase/citrate lyase family protein n=1 Tax=Burkholderia territorii TaxID=1503055 RepID=UPI00075258B8|nr:CoA ester lyase [Burkholderia territorii]KVQ63043.1 aldolase [Burkholderia territorii]